MKATTRRQNEGCRAGRDDLHGRHSVRPDDNVDLDLLRAEVRYLLGQGVTAICACGSTGEGQTLSLEESAAICSVVVDEVAGRVPVIGGVIQNSTAQAKRYSLALKEAGVDAFQVTPVHYVFAPSAEETVAHFREIGEATDLPIVLYNVVPWALVPVDTIEMLASVPQVVAIKQSGGDIHLLADLLHRVRDRFTILAALDDLHYPAFVMGAHGALAAIPTVTPRLSASNCGTPCRPAITPPRSSSTSGSSRCGAPSTRPICQPRSRPPWNCRGRKPGLPRRPFAPATEAERSRIRIALKEADLMD